MPILKSSLIMPGYARQADREGARIITGYKKKFGWKKNKKKSYIKNSQRYRSRFN
ncbi:hypothetical protein KAI52_00620 [Candidatus Parcubacteria bacterium]|nr:hypothetical protein [Candidatus Parcubacteria bacterium]